MMFKSHFGETVSVVLSLVMGVVMAATVIVIDHLVFNWSKLFQIWGMVTLVILLVSIFIPYKEWSEKFTGLFHLNKGSISYKIVDNIVPSLIINTCNTVLVSAANIFYNEAIPAELRMEEWTHGILHDWPITFVVSYLAAFAAEAIGKRVANKYTK